MNSLTSILHILIKALQILFNMLARRAGRGLQLVRALQQQSRGLAEVSLDTPQVDSVAAPTEQQRNVRPNAPAPFDIAP